MTVRATTKLSPTKRSLAHLAANGWVADVAERRQGPITRDLFGCIDIVAVHPVLKQTLFVQCTSNSGGNFMARLKKTSEHPTTKDLLRAGCRVYVWGWTHGAVYPRVARLDLLGDAVVVGTDGEWRGVV